MRDVQAFKRTVHQLLNDVRYTIDFYQREYEWERRNIAELLDDLSDMFLSKHSPEKEREEVQNYPRYFLGTIITSKEDNRNYIVDGQQRLTTITLLLIYINHLSKVTAGRVKDVKPLIFSDNYGNDDFNIHVPSRMDCLNGLYQAGEFDVADSDDVSVNNLVERYDDIKELFPDTLTGDTLPYFVDWLTGNVDLAEIVAYTDDDAFTIFETMNDRGVSLGHVDMLKGFLLANIQHSREKRDKAREEWIKSIGKLRSIDAKADQDFFVAWLRGKYAETIRTRGKSTSTNDFASIKQFHRWVRDNRPRIKLTETNDYFNLITQTFRSFVQHYITIRQAAETYSTPLNEVFYNSRLVTMQHMLALSPIEQSDSHDIARQKIKLVAVFLDIYMARRMVNQKRIGDSTLEETLFGLMRSIRDVDIPRLRKILADYLDNMDETFAGISEGNAGPFRLTQKNRKHITYLLARITAWSEEHSEMNTGFLNYIEARGAVYEIEHIWANDYERHRKEFAGDSEFQVYRNYFGGLVLLPYSANKSYGALSYEEKLPHYVEQNLLAASLHHQKYDRNPGFRKFRERSGLPFEPHKEFKKADLMKRQELYRQICEQIWNPDRLMADN